MECVASSDCKDPTKPVCDASSNTCVGCLASTDCKDVSKPLCNTTAKTCAECLSNADCKSATASLCSGGVCSPCAANADCSHIGGKNVCKVTSASDGDAGADSGTSSSTNECVQCTGSQYSACGQSAGKNLVCNSLTNACSTFAEQSAGLCQTCVSDAQCAGGEMCVDEMFNGQSVGYFCFYKQGANVNGAPADCTLTGRPYSGVLKNSVSIDGLTADICSLATSTCTALNEFSQPTHSCASASGTANDQLCGFAPGVDSKCQAYGSSQFLCTTTCGSDVDCRTGFTCNISANPPVCTFQ